MKQYKLSVLLPSRNEEFLSRTVQDLIEHKRDDTEILVGLDGQWDNPKLPEHEDVTYFYVPESIGQRSMTKRLAKLSKATYLMKLDAHCAVAQDFDTEMLKAFKITGDNVVMIPTMRNLHVFDWVCSCGERKYQDKGDKCSCGKTMTKDIVWIAKKRPESNSFMFDSEPHFQYFNEYTKREPYLTDLKTGLTESMSIQGSCFMLTKEKYLGLDIDDESFGSWGQQGIEVACKFWLSGGRVIVNHKTWYAHCFRTKSENNFGFPYPISSEQVKHARQKSKELFFDNKWDKQIYPLSWLVENFDPPEYLLKKDGTQQKCWTKEDREKLKAWGLPNK